MAARVLCLMVVAFSVVEVLSLSTRRLANANELQDVPVDCVLCQVGVQGLESAIFKRFNITSSKDLVPLVVAICEKVTNQTKQCVQFAPSIAQVIWAVRAPENMCTVVGICPAKDLAIPNVHSNGLSICQLCEDLIGYVQKYILSNTDEVDKLLDEYFCDHLPKDPSTECKKAIQEDLPGLIRKYLNGSEICSAVKLCKSAN